MTKPQVTDEQVKAAFTTLRDPNAYTSITDRMRRVLEQYEASRATAHDDLVAAAKVALRTYERDFPNGQGVIDLRAALAKAEGRSDTPLYASAPAVPDPVDRFEEWAVSDNRRIDPLEYEERTFDNYHYYDDDSTNQAYIGWCHAIRARNP